jgi:hypothetical protein
MMPAVNARQWRTKERIGFALISKLDLVSSEVLLLQTLVFVNANPLEKNLPCASHFLCDLDFSLSSTNLWRRGLGRGGAFWEPLNPLETMRRTANNLLFYPEQNSFKRGF